MSANLQISELFDAAIKLDANRVEHCIQQGLDPNKLDNFGKPPLYYAIAQGYGKNSHAPEFQKVRDTIHVLLFYGAKLNHLNRKEKSLLDDFMYGYKGKKLGATQPTSKEQTKFSVQPIASNPSNSSRSQKDFFEEAKAKVLEGKDSLMKEIPTQTIQSFFENHLESILFSLIGFVIPMYIRNLKSQELYGGDEIWAKISLLLVLPILAFSTFLLIDFWKERKIFRILLTLPPLFSSLVFIGFLFSIQSPQIRYARLIEEYKACFQNSQSICSSMQKGIYQDFIFSEEAKHLRSDESVLLALAEGIKPHSIWAKLGIGEIYEQRTLQREFTRRGFVYYIAELEKGKTTQDIFSSHEGNKIFYSIAFAEANPDLLELSSIPEEIKATLNLTPSEKFPLGILNQERIEFFYKSILKDVSVLSKEETELAFYFLTKFSVNLEENSFENLMEHWITFKPQYEKELKYLTFIRNQIRTQLLTAKKTDLPVGVKFLEESDFAFYKPFLISTGVDFTKGEDISFTFHLQSQADNDSKSTEEVIFPEIISEEIEIPIYVLLSNGLTEEVKSQYPDLELKEETWIYALPASLVCEGCK